MDIFTPNPLQVMLIPAWDERGVDLTWKTSTKANVVGYNVWRAQNAPSNFVKITSSAIQATFFRDTTKIAAATETPTRWESAPDSTTGVVALRMSHTPMVASTLDEQNKPVLAGLSDVRIVNTDNPGVFLQLQQIEAHRGLVILGSRPVLAESFDQWVQTVIPTDLSKLQVSYFYVERFTDSAFGRDLYYKVTEVFSDGTEGDLSQYPWVSNQVLDPADPIWREAMRRTRFIFEQVGELAYLLIRRTTGFLCPCVDPDVMKPRVDCKQCWGVGYIGGYDGPYPITFTPPNAQSQLKQGPDGRFKTRSTQSYIGPTPVITSGDIIIRFNGERLVVLDVERTTVRGTSLQQTYTTEVLRPSDPRWRMSLYNANYPAIQISSNQPVLMNSSNPFEDPIPSNISLQEGVSSISISDPTQDTTKPETDHPEDLRSNTIPSVSPVFENWSF